MKCFIASPLGHTDVDDIYDKVIRPILRGMKIQPVRIDRVEHNDDIDDKIFQLLDSADLCIADLTYARPSVYYEAGYAFASDKPVIYIARKDHFNSKSNDSNDNLRIHFDLQMKNIISWTTPNKDFESKLRRRLNHAIKPIVTKEKQNALLKKSQSEFAALSQTERFTLITAKTNKYLNVLGFQNINISQFQDSRFIMMHRIVNSTHQQINVRIYPSITKSTLKFVRSIPDIYLAYISQQEDRLITRFDFCLLFICLNSFRDDHVSEIFSSYRRVEKNIFEMNGEYMNRKSFNKIVVIDSIKSLEDFVNRYQLALDKVGYE